MNTQGHIIAAEEKVMFDMDYHLKVMQGLFEGEPRSVLLSMFDAPFEMTESPYEELLANIGRRIFSRDEKFQTYPGRERVGTGKDRYMSYIVDYIILKNSTGTPAIDAIYQKVSVFYQQELTSNPEFKTQFETFISYYNEHHSDLEPLKMELIFSDTNNLSAAENEVG